MELLKIRESHFINRSTQIDFSSVSLFPVIRSAEIISNDDDRFVSLQEAAAVEEEIVEAEEAVSYTKEP